MSACTPSWHRHRWQMPASGANPRQLGTDGQARSGRGSRGADLLPYCRWGPRWNAPQHFSFFLFFLLPPIPSRDFKIECLRNRHSPGSTLSSSSRTDTVQMRILYIRKGRSAAAFFRFPTVKKPDILPASVVVHKLSAVSLVGFEIFNLVSIAGTMDMIH